MSKLHDCLAKYFHKTIHMLVFNKYFYKNKKSKLYFGDSVVVVNDFIYQTGGVTHRLKINSGVQTR
jgi:hypothetical protein